MDYDKDCVLKDGDLKNGASVDGAQSFDFKETLSLIGDHVPDFKRSLSDPSSLITLKDAINLGNGDSCLEQGIDHVPDFKRTSSAPMIKNNENDRKRRKRKKPGKNIKFGVDPALEHDVEI